jgi:hypothetical protein
VAGESLDRRDSRLDGGELPPLPAVLRFFTMHNDTIGALLVLGLLLWQRTARSRAPLTILHPGSPQPV